MLKIFLQTVSNIPRPQSQLRVNRPFHDITTAANNSAAGKLVQPGTVSGKYVQSQGV